MSRADSLVPGNQPATFEGPVNERAMRDKRGIRRAGGFALLFVGAVAAVGYLTWAATGPGTMGSGSGTSPIARP